MKKHLIKISNFDSNDLLLTAVFIACAWHRVEWKWFWITLIFATINAMCSNANFKNEEGGK